MATPKPKVLTGKAAISAYEKSITETGKAKAAADAKKALEAKYPGMFITDVRTSAGVNRGN